MLSTSEPKLAKRRVQASLVVTGILVVVGVCLWTGKNPMSGTVDQVGNSNRVEFSASVDGSALTFQEKCTAFCEKAVKANQVQMNQPNLCASDCASAPVPTAAECPAECLKLCNKFFTSQTDCARECKPFCATVVVVEDTGRCLDQLNGKWESNRDETLSGLLKPREFGRSTSRDAEFGLVTRDGEAILGKLDGEMGKEWGKLKFGKGRHKTVALGENEKGILFSDNTVVVADMKTCEVTGVYVTKTGDIHPQVRPRVEANIETVADSHSRSAAVSIKNTGVYPSMKIEMVHCQNRHSVYAYGSWITMHLYSNWYSNELRAGLCLKVVKNRVFGGSSYSMSENWLIRIVSGRKCECVMEGGWWNKRPKCTVGTQGSCTLQAYTQGCHYQTTGSGCIYANRY